MLKWLNFADILQVIHYQWQPTRCQDCLIELWTSRLCSKYLLAGAAVCGLQYLWLEFILRHYACARPSKRGIWSTRCKTLSKTNQNDPKIAVILVKLKDLKVERYLATHADRRFVGTAGAPYLWWYIPLISTMSWPLRFHGFPWYVGSVSMKSLWGTELKILKEWLRI